MVLLKVILLFIPYQLMLQKILKILFFVKLFCVHESHSSSNNNKNGAFLCSVLPLNHDTSPNKMVRVV